MNSGGIITAYIGVHQMFQLALAAHELGELHTHYCSLVSKPWGWGRFLPKSMAASLSPLGVESIPSNKIKEIPGPMLQRRLSSMWRRTGPVAYDASNKAFDSKVARRLTRNVSVRVFVGVESCAVESFQAAKQARMRTILDCPGIPADFLAAHTQRACDELGIPFMAGPKIAMAASERKREELELADLVTVCSELQRGLLVAGGVEAAKIRVNPLWVDPVFWSPAGSPMRPKDENVRKALQVLYVGAGTVSKGVPYALLAAEMLGDRAEFTFCGGLEERVRRWCGNRIKQHRLISWLPRAELSSVYRAHDVLVFPTLGDSFGFVVLEAMACGLPVVVTTSAGAPVPDSRWRVASHDAAALAARLRSYAENRSQLESDSALAVEFARSFTPEAFRNRAQAIYREVLA